MPEKSFDLNKALNAAGLYTKINYGDVYIPDIQRVTNNFETWRKSQGYKTEEEKQEDLKAEMQAAQQRFNEQGLWNSEDPYEVYNTYETDPYKQADFQRKGQITAGIGSAIATLPFTAGTMGWIPGTVSTIAGTAGGYGGSYGGQRLGQYLDTKYGLHTAPYLSFFGGLAGGILGGGLGYRGTVQLGSAGLLPKNNAIGNLYSSQFAKDVGVTALNRQLRWPKNRNINTVTEPTSVARFRTTPSTETQAPISAQSFIQTSKLADDLDAQFNTWRKSQGLDDNTPITYDEIERFVDNSNDPLLLRNYYDFIDDLKKKSIYHETLSANDIQRELPWMQTAEIDMTVDPVVELFLQHDALPRLLDNFKKSGVNLTSDDITWITDLYKNPTKGVDMKIGYAKPGSGGYSNGVDFIRFSNREYALPDEVPLSTVLHELHHSMRSRLQAYLKAKGYKISEPVDPLLLSTNPNRRISQTGMYLQNELDAMLPLHMRAKYLSDLTPTSEIGAVMASNARFPIWLNKYNSLGKVPSIKDTNAAIRIIPNDVISSEARLLPYGQQIGSGMIDDYMSNMSQRFIKGEDITPIREQFIRQHGNALKKAMETIAGFTLPVASYQYVNKNK